MSQTLLDMECNRLRELAGSSMTGIADLLQEQADLDDRIMELEGIKARLKERLAAAEPDDATAIMAEIDSNRNEIWNCRDRLEDLEDREADILDDLDYEQLEIVKVVHKQYDEPLPADIQALDEWMEGIT